MIRASVSYAQRSPDRVQDGPGFLLSRGATMTQPTSACDTCEQPATHLSSRDATDDEAAAYRQALNDHRTSLGFEPFPETSAIMTLPVTMGVLHCCNHRPGDHAACDDCPEITADAADTPAPAGP